PSRNRTLRNSEQQRDKLAATGDFEFAEDSVNVLFHSWHTQSGAAGDFFVTPPLADESRNFLFTPRKLEQTRQNRARIPGPRNRLPTQVLALDEKMRPRQTD